MELDPLDVRPDNIWNYAQNKPSLIINDLTNHGVAPHVTAHILMARGVYKWLNVRRELIKLKNLWRDRIKDINQKLAIKDYADKTEHQRLVTELRTLESCCKQVRALCHSERWACPDFDKKSMKYFDSNK